MSFELCSGLASGMKVVKLVHVEEVHGKALHLCGLDSMISFCNVLI